MLVASAVAGSLLSSSPILGGRVGVKASGPSGPKTCPSFLLLPRDHSPAPFRNNIMGSITSEITKSLCYLLWAVISGLNIDLKGFWKLLNHIGTLFYTGTLSAPTVNITVRGQNVTLRCIFPHIETRTEAGLNVNKDFKCNICVGQEGHNILVCTIK